MDKIQDGQSFARHTPIFSNASTDAPYHRLFLATMLFHIISDLPGDKYCQMQKESGKAANKPKIYLI